MAVASALPSTGKDSLIQLAAAYSSTLPYTGKDSLPSTGKGSLIQFATALSSASTGRGSFHCLAFYRQRLRLLPGLKSLYKKKNNHSAQRRLQPMPHPEKA